MNEFGLESGRIKGLTGVWIDHDNEKTSRKIAALGVKTSRWVTLHGLAFNVNTNLDYFKYIVPCGLDDKAVTSMEKELGHSQDLLKIKSTLLKKICSIFEMEMIN